MARENALQIYPRILDAGNEVFAEFRRFVLHPRAGELFGFEF
jgi:hypothetical protein